MTLEIRQVKRNDEYQKRAKEKDIHNLNVFFELPTKYENPTRSLTKNFSVFISNPENPSCSSKKEDFSVTIRKTSSLHLKFMNLIYDPYTASSGLIREDYASKALKQNKYCIENNIEVSDYNIIHQFANSKEANEYLPMMYPIGEDQVSSEVFSRKYLFAVLGTCNNEYYSDTEATVGLLSDMMEANNMVELIDLNDDPFKLERGEYSTYYTDGFPVFNKKLIVIVSENYMRFHGLGDTAGFTIIPKRIDDILPIGNWNVAFVSEETLEDRLARGKRKAQGIVLHEIAHLLGQGKEYYEQKDKDDNTLPDHRQSRCRKFSSEPQIFCYKYKIFGGLLASFKNKNWTFINEKTSFMDNEPEYPSNLGIDRETFQKLFQTLLHEKLDPTSSNEQEFIQKFKKRIPVVSLSGLYDKNKGEFYNGFSIIHEKGFPSFSDKKGEIEILLTRRVETNDSIKYEILSRMNPITELEMEFLFENGGGKRIDLDVIPVTAKLPIPREYLNNQKLGEDLYLIVRENFYTISKKDFYIHNISFGGSRQSVSKKGRVLYKAPID